MSQEQKSSVKDNSDALVFVIEHDENERSHICDIVSSTGCATVALPSVEKAVLLLKNNAACNLIVLADEALDDRPELFDELMAAHSPPPPIFIYGAAPDGKMTLHCLNRGASDFFIKPINENQLVNAILHTVSGDADISRSEFLDAIQASQPVTGWIELTALSELEQLRRIQRFADVLVATQLPEDVCDDVMMALEEVGRNAFEWGNNFNPEKRVHISYCLFSDRIVLKVQDEGEGFEPEMLPDPTADPVGTMLARRSAGKRPGGYGVYLLRKLMDSIVYNEKGNTVLLIKYFPANAT